MGRTRRLLRLGLAASLLAATAAIGAAPVASAQSDEGMLAVRGIDGTDRDAIKVTFLYTGQPQDLEGLTVREDGDLMVIDDLTNLRKTEQRLGTVYVVDLSGSMADDGTLTDVKTAMADIADKLPAGDEAAIVSFSDTVVVESGFTDSTAQLQEAVDEMAAPRDGKAAVWDGIRKGSTLFETRPELQPNIVLVTDSIDDASRVDVDAARASVVNSGAAFFTVELDHAGGVDSGAFRTIMDRTGGAAFVASPGDATETAFQQLSATLQSQYVASYASSVRQGQVDVEVAVGSLESEGLLCGRRHRPGGSSW